METDASGVYLQENAKPKKSLDGIVPTAVATFSAYTVAFGAYNAFHYEEIKNEYYSNDGIAQNAEDTADALVISQLELTNKGLIDESVQQVMITQSEALIGEATAIRQDMPNLTHEQLKMHGASLTTAILLGGLTWVTRKKWKKIIDLYNY